MFSQIVALRSLARSHADFVERVRRGGRTSQRNPAEHGGILDHENTAVFSCLDHVHGENRRSLVSF
jgi:hypothetical protein